MKPRLELPEAVFDQHVIVLGKTRSGKSSAMRLLVEHLLDQHKPVCIVDPKGDWWGLKSSGSGKQAGYPVVIFGGEHADVPLNDRAGKTVAELVATGNRPCIIDLGGWMPAERTRFWIDFASAFFSTHRGRRCLVIDEVHNLCPKGKVPDPQAGMMLHWSNRLASEGLGRGISLIAASQRPQKVHNDFLTSCETLVAMRVIHAADRGAIGDWIDACGDPERGKELLRTTAAMKRGEAWVYSPEAEFGPKRIQFPLFSTYDSFRAQAGTRPARLKGWADVDLAEVTAKLAVIVKEAEANDPAKLQARIRELERQLRVVGKPTQPARPVGAQLERKAIVEELTRLWEAERRKYQAELDAAHHRQVALYQCVGELARGSDLLKQRADRTLRAVSPKIVKLAKVELLKVAPVRILPPAPPRAEASQLQPGEDGKLRAGAERMLAALATWYPNGMSRGQMRAHAGLKKSGTVSTYISDLRRRGFTEERDAQIFATEAGLEYCKHVPSAPQTTEEVLAVWEPKLRSGARRMLRVLVEAAGVAMTREELVERAGLTNSGTVTTYLGDLRTARLLADAPDRKVSANKETLFLP